MRAYSLSHLTDPELLRGLASLIAQDRVTTAALLAHLAEVDARRLYLPAAYPSMYLYCVGELRMSEDSACKRIRAARAARQFPAIFEALADGRLHLSAVVLLAPHLTRENADELLAAAAHKTKAEIEELVARRFPRSETPGRAVPGHLPSNLPRGKLARAPSWRRWRRNGSSSSSRSDAAPRTSCATPRTCSAISSPPETSPKCSTAPSTP